MNNRACLMANNMHAKNAIRFGICQNFHKAFTMPLGAGAAIGRKWEISNLIGNASLFQHVFAFAKCRDFRCRIDNAGHQIIINMPGLAGHHLDRGNTILFGFMRQHRSINHVTNGKDTLDIRFKTGINLDPAAFAYCQLDLVSAKPVNRRMTSNRNQRNIGLDRFRVTAICGFDCQRHASLAGFGCFHRCFQLERQTLFFGNRHKFFGNFRIHAGQDTRQEFNHFDLGTKTRPDGAKLQPDIASTNHNKFFGHFAKRQSPCRTNNPIFVNFDSGQA